MNKITLSEVERRIKERYPSENFKILSYESLGKSGKIECLNCGKIIEINKFSNFFAKSKKYGCSDCQSVLKKEREEILKKIKEKYTIIETEVKDTHTYYKIECLNCGHQRKDTLGNFKRHLECGCQTGVKRKRTIEEVENEINLNSIDGTYKIIGEYKNQSTPILLQHSCGFIWKVRPSDVIKGRSRCPKCGKQQSRGEKIIETYFIQNSIPYQAEKLLNNSRQRFDFYLENNKHKIAIEYNGAQHYKEVNYFSSTLDAIQERDKRKELYCKENNIDLFIIPYTMNKNEIYNFLDDIVNKFND